jgi:hypothetical protein
LQNDNHFVIKRVENQHGVGDGGKMEVVLLLTYAEATLFWVCVIGEMAFATWLFGETCRMSATDDDEFDNDAVEVASRLLGCFVISAPVLQAGQWLHGSKALAWVLVIGPPIIWAVIVVASQRAHGAKLN